MQAQNVKVLFKLNVKEIQKVVAGVEITHAPWLKKL